MKKILTIGIAAYNAERWLERCLDSFVIKEMMNDIEVLIINDGSTDGTKKIAEHYVSDYPNTFRLINKENGGHGSTINASIKEANGNYFKIVDADDWVESEGMVDLLLALKEDWVDAIITPYYQVDARTGEKIVKEIVCNSDGLYPNQVISAKEARINFLSMHSLTFRTDILKQNFTPIDENCFYVDCEYTVFYYSHVKTVMVTKVPLYNYFFNNAEQSVNISNQLRQRDQHLKMCERIISFYNERTEEQPLSLDTVRNTVYSVIFNEYHLLTKIEDSSQSKKEFMDFDYELKLSFGDEDYKGTVLFKVKLKSKLAIAVWLLRKTHFHGYKLLHILESRIG